MQERISPIDELLVDQFIELPRYSIIFTSIKIRGISLNDIAEKLGYPKSSVHYVLKKLLRAGLITKFRGLDARRAYYFFTIRGLRVYRLLLERLISLLPKREVYVEGKGKISGFKESEAFNKLSKYVANPEELFRKMNYVKIEYKGENYWVKLGNSKPP